MKIGAEKKWQVVLLTALLVVAAAMLWRSLAPAVPVPAAAAPVVSSPRPATAALPIDHTDPRLHLNQLRRLQAVDYRGTGRDLFRFGPAPTPAPPTPAQRAAAAVAAARAAGPSPPPPPPPIPLKFYGFAQTNGAPERIFLQLGEDSYVVTQGETIAHRYLIENIGKVSVRVKDLQTQSEQELPLQQG